MGAYIYLQLENEMLLLRPISIPTEEVPSGEQRALIESGSKRIIIDPTTHLKKLEYELVLVYFIVMTLFLPISIGY